MSIYKTPIRPDELYHYGVPGMKWGVRKERISLGLRRAGSAIKTGTKKTGVMIKKAHTNLKKDPRTKDVMRSAGDKRSRIASNMSKRGERITKGGKKIGYGSALLRGAGRQAALIGILNASLAYGNMSNSAAADIISTGAPFVTSILSTASSAKTVYDMASVYKYNKSRGYSY